MSTVSGVDTDRQHMFGPNFHLVGGLPTVWRQRPIAAEAGAWGDPTHVGASRMARAVTAMLPKIVPLIVCGLRNFQKAVWNSATRAARLRCELPSGSETAAVDASQLTRLPRSFPPACPAIAKMTGSAFAATGLLCASPFPHVFAPCFE